MVRNSLRLLGHMAACNYIVQYACFKLLLGEVYSQRRHHIDMLVHTSNWILSYLDWCMDLANVCKGVPFILPQQSLSLETDASDLS